MKNLTKIAVLAMVAVLILVGCTKPVAEDPKPPVKEYYKQHSADVIVVGAGGAGLAAAITAKENGASVILLEKLSFTGGALNTTSGTISGAKTKIQQEDGLTEDTIESYVQDILKEGRYQGDEALIRAYAENAGLTVDWLMDNGLKIGVDRVTGKRAIIAPEHTPYSYPRTYRPIAPEGYYSGVHAVLDNLLESLNVDIHFNTEAVKLLTDSNGVVIGLEALDSDGNEIKYTASKGVIMTTGGYAANPKLMGAFNDHAKNYITGGLSSASGYGIYMMQQAGAMIHEEAMGWIPSYPMGLEIRPGQGIIRYTKTQFMGGILVNVEGKRFVNEAGGNVEREEALAEQPKGTQWEIYNQEIVDRMLKDDVHPFYNAMLKMIMAQYPEQIIRGETLEELATKITVPVEAFVRTVNDYSSYVRTGVDPDFNRSFEPQFGNPRSFVQAINTLENGPYFAVKIKPISLFTMGGVKANDKFQVLHVSGQPIPGLYAAGETVGGLWGEFPSGGTGVTGAVTTGRLAGQNVVSLPQPSFDVSKASLGTQKQIGADLFVVDATGDADDDTGVVYKDGEYTGVAKGYIADITVKVTVSQGKIGKIEIVEQRETESIARKALNEIPVSIVEKNSTNVDSISGATATSDAIKAAVRDALKGARN